MSAPKPDVEARQGPGARMHLLPPAAPPTAVRGLLVAPADLDG